MKVTTKVHGKIIQACGSRQEQSQFSYNKSFLCIYCTNITI